MRKLFIAGSLLVGGGVLLAYLATGEYDAPGPLTRPLAVVVPHGGANAVAATLRAAGVLDDVAPFRIFAALTAWQGPMRSAEFLFPKGASLRSVLIVLRAGKPVQHLLTIPEGLTASRIVRLTTEAGGLAGDIDLPMEGAILPESYSYVLGAERNAILARAAKAMSAALEEAWDARAAGLSLRSPRELLIMASMVELETHVGAERPMVARVLLNRLDRGMRLQSDPTVVYGESGGAGDLPSGLTRAALGRWTPYNTYMLPGLPAGPVCAPGAASIAAVAHPASSAALYFVADGRGGLVFSDTLERHNHNVERYHALTR